MHRFVMLICTSAVAAALLVLGLGGPASAATVPDTPGSSPTFDGIVRAVAVRGDVIYVGGSFTHVVQGMVPAEHIAAFSAVTGDLIANWQPSFDGTVYSLAATKEGLYVGGRFSSALGRPSSDFARVSLADGTNPAVLTAHPKVNHPVWAIAATRFRLYIGGAFTTVRGKVRDRLASFNRSDLSLGAWAPRADHRVRALRPTTHTVVVGGYFASINSVKKANHLAVISKRTGRLSRSFHAAVGYPVFDIRKTASRLYVGTGGPGGHVLSLTRQGGKVWGHTFDGDVQALTLMDGTVYAGGHFDNLCHTDRTGNFGDCRDPGQIARVKLVAFDTSGNLLSWSPTANSADGIEAMRAAGTQLAVGGAFTTVGGAAQKHFALF